MRTHFATASFHPLNKRGKAVAHSASILFFSGLLVALGFTLELTVRAYWGEIVAAVRGVPFAAPEVSRVSVAKSERQWRAAA